MVAESVRDVIGAEANALMDSALDTATSGLKSMVMARAGPPPQECTTTARPTQGRESTSLWTTRSFWWSSD